MKKVKVGTRQTQEPWRCRKVSCRYFFQDGTSRYNQYGVGFPESCSTQDMVDSIVRHCKELSETGARWARLWSWCAGWTARERQL